MKNEKIVFQLKLRLVDNYKADNSFKKGGSVELEKIKELIQKIENIKKFDEYTNVEMWSARDLKDVLGYSNWRSFKDVIEKARSAITNSGLDPDEHIIDVDREATGTVKTRINDMLLTRYACYLTAQNGNPRKEEISFAQTYFAAQTHNHETLIERLKERERLDGRNKLKESEKNLASSIAKGTGFEGPILGRVIAVIKSEGDKSLFGGHTTKDMKKKLGVPEGSPLADFASDIVISMKSAAASITSFTIQRDNLNSKNEMVSEHKSNNKNLRAVLLEKNIVIENIPPQEDTKKIERRIKSDEVKLLKNKKNK